MAERAILWQKLLFCIKKKYFEDKKAIKKPIELFQTPESKKVKKAISRAKAILKLKFQSS